MNAPRQMLVVLFGGQSAEHDVSRVTASHVMRAADPSRYDIVAVGIDRDGAWRMSSGHDWRGDAPRTIPEPLEVSGPVVDPTAAVTRHPGAVVVPLLHGPMGEDGTVQGLLELAGVPYVGSGVLASALAMDKGIAKRLFAAAGIPQVGSTTLHYDECSPKDLLVLWNESTTDLFVKPANMGSSVGVSRVSSPEELVAAVDKAARYDNWIVIEEAVHAREIEVAVLGNRRPRASLPGEITPSKDFYDYEDKYVDDAATLTVPARLTAEQVKEVQSLAVRAYGVLRCEGMARVDFFLEEGGRGFLINEVNTIPGFTPISMYPKMWEASGLPYPALIDELVRLALERHAGARRDTGR